MRFQEMLAQQDQIGLPRTVLFTDIDNTLRMKDGSLADVTQRLCAACEAENVPIVAVTGTTFSFVRSPHFDPPFLSIEERLATGNLPHLPVIYTEVGTRRWWLKNDQYEEDTSYADLLRARGFNKKILLAEIEQLSVKMTLAQQPNNQYEPYKLTYFFHPETFDQVSQLLTLVRTRYPKLQIAAGIDLDDPTRKRYWLDILPLDKSEAVSLLCQEYAITGLIRAGDSPNDESMLLGERSSSALDLAIIVGGAEESLRHHAQGSKRPQLYIETGSEVGPQSIIKAINRYADQHPVLARLAARLRYTQ